MWQFRCPQLKFGEDSLETLRGIEGEKAFIITGKTVSKQTFFEKILNYLEIAGLEVLIFDEVQSEPSFENVREGAKIAAEFGPDWIIGLGGGSNMDAAKAIWVLYERPDLSLYDINPFTELGLRKKARYIAIPTTSGTGSEVTGALVITDTKEHRKMGFDSEEIIADISIIDPALPSKMPPGLTADTGLDALTHSIEAYVSQWKNDFSDVMAIKAMQLIFKYLPKAYKNGNDREAREKMHNAATMAGLAIESSMVGIAHSLGHAFGASFKIPHGKAVGLFLPYVAEYNAKEALDRYVDIARAIGIRGEPKEAVQRLVEKIRDLIAEINEPLSIKEMGIIDAKGFKSKLERLVDHASEDASAVSNPRMPNKEELEKLYNYAWEGKKVDF